MSNWIKHDGTGRPVFPETIVKVKHRDGFVALTCRADWWEGVHYNDNGKSVIVGCNNWVWGDAAIPDFDIIEYMVIR